MGGHERYALAGGCVHVLDCPDAARIPGDGGYVDSVAYGESLGFKRCPKCLKVRSGRKKGVA